MRGSRDECAHRIRRGTDRRGYRLGSEPITGRESMSLVTSTHPGLSSFFEGQARWRLALMRRLLRRRWAYEMPGLLGRMGCDLLMANLGLFLGYVACILYNSLTRSELVTSFWIERLVVE